MAGVLMGNGSSLCGNDHRHLPVPCRTPLRGFVTPSFINAKGPPDGDPSSLVEAAGVFGLRPHPSGRCRKAATNIGTFRCLVEHRSADSLLPAS